MKPNIISISGKAGAGKDLVGKIIQYLTCKNENKDSLWSKEAFFGNHIEATYWLELYSDFKIKKFGAPIKQIASIMTGIPIQKMETQEDKEVVLGDEWSKSCSLNNCDACREESKCKVMFVDNKYNKLSMRRLLQRIGDQMLQIHPDWLLNVMFKDYKTECDFDNNTPMNKNWIITDMRKPNEYNKVKEYNGKCIKVIKTGQISTDNHISETALDNETEWDYIIEAEHGDIDSLIRQVKEMLIKFEIL